MGTGKSTVGARVARAHSAAFSDLDVVIEGRAKKTVCEIFAEDGEHAFRALEKAQLHEVLTSQIPPSGLVVALGGGALLGRGSRNRALDTAFVVTLTASVAHIMARTAADTTRPLLAERDVERVRALLLERADAYAQAHLVVDTDGLSPAEVAERLTKRWSPSVG